MAAEVSERRAVVTGDRGESIGVTSSDGSLHPWTEGRDLQAEHGRTLSDDAG